MRRILKWLFNHLKGDGTFRSFIDLWLLFLGVGLLILGEIIRFFQRFSAIGPESKPFFWFGTALVAMGAVGIGVAKFRGKNTERSRKGAP